MQDKIVRQMRGKLSNWQDLLNFLYVLQLATYSDYQCLFFSLSDLGMVLNDTRCQLEAYLCIIKYGTCNSK